MWHFLLHYQHFYSLSVACHEKKTPSHLQQHHNNLFLHCFSVGTENVLGFYNLLLSYVDDDCEKEPELSLEKILFFFIHERRGADF